MVRRPSFDHQAMYPTRWIWKLEAKDSQKCWAKKYRSQKTAIPKMVDGDEKSSVEDLKILKI